MNFYSEYIKYRDFNFDNFFKKLSDNDVIRAINKENLNEYDFLALLSKKAEKYLEDMAQKASKLTQQHFGKVIFLYTPLYLANYCVNQCAYCGFNITNKITRKKLKMEEVDREARVISKTGLKHILILTGESKGKTPLSYIKKCVEILKKYFTSITIEIYPLTEKEYKELVWLGVDGVTVYQEVYNEKTYDKIHISGPKKDYKFRIDTPERACKGGIRSVNIGALLGLDHWRKESFFTGIHGNFLQNKYLDTEVSISLPRIRPHVGSFQSVFDVEDKHIVQIMLALRLYMPRVGITISTREEAGFRDNLIGLGVTKMSAGSSTEVGGHTLEEKTDGQFDISDIRSVEEMKNCIYKKGYQPVFKDWQAI